LKRLEEVKSVEAKRHGDKEAYKELKGVSIRGSRESDEHCETVLFLVFSRFFPVLFFPAI